VGGVDVLDYLASQLIGQDVEFLNKARTDERFVVRRPYIMFLLVR